MTASTQHDTENGPGPAPRTGRWQLPGGCAATEQVRRTVHSALRKWGLGPAAGDLTDHLTALVQELVNRTATRSRDSIHLRLELRASARLLLGEIHNLPSDPAEGGHPACGHAGDRGVVALTYGHRPSRNGGWYIHSFTWWQPDAITTDR